MSKNIEQKLTTALYPTAVNSDGWLQWHFESNPELHAFVSKLNDMILNELYYRSITYGEYGTMFKPKDGSEVNIVMNTQNLTVKVKVQE